MKIVFPTAGQEHTSPYASILYNASPEALAISAPVSDTYSMGIQPRNVYDILQTSAAGLDR